ncbi:MAG: YigZ family protein [Clostridia bacterium]|nr:YigZ family protein [Clostridia bacterium]
MIDNFFTIQECEYTAEFVEKKSKFIATLIKVNSEEEAIERLTQIRKKYRDAKHNVFSYRIANNTERFSDDGEPSGTAGVPILDILRGEKLQNVLLVVTRYFGGILLGTGGLVKAYSTVAKDVILQAPKVEMKLCNEYHIEVDYNYHNILLHYFKEQSIIVRDTNFSDKVSLNIIVKAEKSDEILAQIAEKTDRTANIMLALTYYHE